MFYPSPDYGQNEVTFTGADRRPCVVCGDPHGDCKGSVDYKGGINIIPKKLNDPSATFRVPRRIYEEIEVNGKKRRKLLYPLGAAITPLEAKRLGLLPKE